MQGLNLFPTKVFHTALENHTELNKLLLSSVALLRATDPGIQKSNKGGWHSDDKILLYHPAFKDLLTFVQDSAALVCKDLQWTLDLAVINCWVTVSPPGAGNSMHTHPGALLSGVYYIKVPSGSSPLMLHDPRSAKVHSIPQGQHVTASTADRIALVPQPGGLFLFPGWLQHSVEDNTTSEDRVVFSFNLV